MKNIKVNRNWIGGLLLSFILVFSVFSSCESSDIKADRHDFYPPDTLRESSLESFSPDSGGIATQLILTGYNLGTDTSYLRVTVNNKNARIIRVDRDREVRDRYFLYAVVPARADTGKVRLYVGPEGQRKEYTSEYEFSYLFKRNVSTLAGIYEKIYENEKAPTDGLYKEALFRRPWVIKSDSEGALYVIDEGRGTNKNGALRKLFNGFVETLAMNNSGPFQSPTDIAFSLNEDTMYIANKSHRSGVLTDACIIYSTRDNGFVNWRNLVVKGGLGTTTVAVHPKTGELFFNSNTDGHIYRYNENMPDKVEKLIFVSTTGESDGLKMVFNNDGTTLYMTVSDKHCIYKANYDISTREFSTPELFVGQIGEAGYTNGVGTAAKLDKPYCIVVDEDENIFVAERHNHIVRKITPKGETSLWAGTPRQWGNKDGLPDIAVFRDPQGLCIDQEGSMFVAEMGGHTIRKVVVE